MPKVVPTTVPMVIAAFQNAPETKAIKRLLLDIRLYVFLRLKNLNVPSNSSLLLSSWALSHVLCGGGFGLYLCTENAAWYYLCLCGALYTYLLMVLRHVFVLWNGYRQALDGPPLSWVTNSENATLATMAGTCLLSSPRTVKIVSFGLYLVLNLATFSLQCASSSIWPKVMMPLIHQVEPALLAAAVYADTTALVCFVYDAFLSRDSWALAVFYLLLLLKRLEQSSAAASCLHNTIDVAETVTLRFASLGKVHRAVLTVKTLLVVLVPDTRRSGQDSDTPTRVSRAPSSVFVPADVVHDI